MKITKRKNDWFAEVWLNRNQFSATGQSEQEAKDKLREFMESRVEIWESKIAVDKQTLNDIESWLWENRPKKMSQVVASNWHFDEDDSLPAKLAALKQEMVEQYAREIGLEPRREKQDYAEFVIVDCDERQILDLVSTLNNKGCTDLHVYSEDETTRSMIEGGSYGPFRVCEGLWTP